MTDDVVREVLADPFYGPVYELLKNSVAEVEDAGFFSAGREVVTQAGVEWMSVPVEKIRRRLVGRDEERPVVVLLTTGALDPVHTGHVRMMECARVELEARGFLVAGGYLSPSHDAYVKGKSGARALDAVARVDLCQAVTADSEWLMAADWEALGVDRAVNFTDVIVWLDEYLKRHVPGVAIEVVYVFGSDNARFVRTFLMRGRCVCVVRPGALGIERFRGDPLVRDNPRVVFAGESVAASSSQVRDGRVELMEARSRRRYAQLTGDAKGERRRGTYVLRDECGWEVEPWLAGRDREQVMAARRWLYDELAALIRGAHARVGTEVEFHWLRLDEQRAQVAALAGERVLSIDAPIRGDANLAVSRCFPLAGAGMGSVISPRPGSAQLAEQLAELAPGDYVLVDDDVSTGATLAGVRALLPAGVRVVREHVLFRRDGQLDILDCRDFLAGSREGGLVVAAFDGSLARAPYCAPYVSASERASIPLAEELGFSCALWRLNEAFFARVSPEIRLAEAGAAFAGLMRGLGFAPETPMAAVCRWHAEGCEQMRVRAGLWRETARGRW